MMFEDKRIVMLKKNKGVFCENIFLVGYALLIWILFLEQTTFEVFLTSRIFQMLAVLVVFVLGLVNLIVNQSKEWKKTDIMICSILGITLTVSFIISYKYDLLVLAILLIGAKGVSFKKILRVYLYAVSGALLFTMLMALCGSIENLVYYQANRNFSRRISFGMIYPSYFSEHVFSLAACYLWYRNHKITYKELMGVFLTGVFCGFFCVSRSELFTQTLLVGMMALSKYAGEKNFFQYAGHLKKMERRTMNAFITAIPSAIAFFSIVTAACYNENSALHQKIDSFFSGRLYYGHKALTEYPLTLLGQEVIINSNEGHTVNTIDYFMIDSSYISILQELGIITLLAVLISYSYIFYSLCRKGKWNEIIIMTVMMNLCMSKPNLMNISFFPFILLLTADDSESEKTSKQHRHNKIANVIYEESRKVYPKKHKRYMVSAGVILTFLAVMTAALFLRRSSGKEQEGYYVSDYGIYPYTEDCTESLQKLIDQVYYDGGGTIYFDKGTYYCSGLVLRDSVSVQGEGIDQTILMQNSQAENDGKFLYISDAMNGLKMADLTLCGNDVKNDSIGLYLEHEYSPEVYEEYYEARELDAEEVEVNLQRIKICHFASDGCYIGVGNNNVVIEGSQFVENGADGMKIMTSNSKVKDCRFISNMKSGIVISGEGHTIESVTAMENGMEDETSWGVYIYSSGCKLKQVEARRNYCGGINITGDHNMAEQLASQDNGSPHLLDGILIYIEGKENQITGTCEKSSQSVLPAAYAVADCSENSNVNITIEEMSAESFYK